MDSGKMEKKMVPENLFLIQKKNTLDIFCMIILKVKAHIIIRMEMCTLECGKMDNEMDKVNLCRVIREY